MVPINGATSVVRELTDGQRRRGLVAVMVSAVAVGLTIGMAAPLIAVTMAAAGAGNALVGVNAGMPALAVLMTAPLVPRLIAGVGMVWAMVLGCLLSALALALFPLLDTVPSWFVLRFATGAGLAVQWVASETWLSRVAVPESRGRSVACYAAMWGVGLAGGPVMLQVTGIGGGLPFVVVAFLILIAALPPIAARASVPDGPARSDGGGWSWALFRVAPATIFAGFTTGFVEISLVTLMPLYGQSAGMTRSEAVMTVSALAIGGVIWQLPLGWLADRLSAGRVLLLAAAGGIAAALAVDLTFGTMTAESVAQGDVVGVGGGVLWPILFLWGGLMSSFYTLGLMQIGQKFGAADLPHATVLFIMAYTVGTVFGPTLSGVALDMWPAHGLPMVAGVVYCGYLVCATLFERSDGKTDGVAR